MQYITNVHKNQFKLLQLYKITLNSLNLNPFFSAKLFVHINPPFNQKLHNLAIIHSTSDIMKRFTVSSISRPQISAIPKQIPDNPNITLHLAGSKERRSSRQISHIHLRPTLDQHSYIFKIIPFSSNQ